MTKALFIALLTIGGGFVASYMSCRVSADIRGAKGWPTTPGKILERGVGPPMETTGRMYLPMVKYEYSVGGKQHANDQVYLIRKTGGTADEMKDLVNALPNPVDVHYDPDKPASSYLLVNPMGTYWILVAFAIGAFVLGALQLGVALMKKP